MRSSDRAAVRRDDHPPSGMGLALVLWLVGLLVGDAIFIALTQRQLSAGTFVRGAALALTLGAALAAALGALLGLARWLVPAARRPLGARVSDFALAGTRRARARRVGASLAVVVLGCGYALGLFLVASAIDARVVRTHFVALGVTGASLALLIIAALAFPPAQRLGARVASRAAPSAVGWPLRRPANLFAVLGAAALIAAVTITVAAWETFQHLPWAVLLRVALALASGAAAWPLAATLRGRPRLGRALAVAAALLVLAALVVSLRLRPEQQAARQLGSMDSLAGTLGNALVHGAFDVDRDGHLPFFGGGDCRPFDAQRHRGAIDRPGNGVDEDCDGRDAEESVGLPVGRYDWPTRGVPVRPDIVLITIDALSARHLEVNGYERSAAPQLDRLARASVNFDSAFAHGPSTRLSFPSLFTSRWDSELPRAPGGRQPFPITCRRCQLAEYLDAAGYRTEAHLPDRYFSRAQWGSLTNGFDRVTMAGAGVDGFNAPEVSDRALAAFAGDGGPRFVWAHYFDIHGPYRAPPEGARFGETTRDLYDAALHHLDAQVGRLIEGIRARSPDALIIVTSDHATAFHPVPGARKGHYGYDLYTSTLHVPLIFSAPWLPARRVSGIVSTMDVTPTILNLLGQRVAAPLRGESLVPELLHGAERRDRQLFHQFYLPERRETGHPLAAVSVRSDRFDLIWEPEQARYQLFDWRRDYHELEERLEAGEAPEEYGALRALLEGYVRDLARPRL